MADLGHSMPLIKIVWKATSTRLRRSDIREILNQGHVEMHQAGKVLTDNKCRHVMDLEEYGTLAENHVALRQKGIDLDRKLGALKSHHILAKYKVWVATTSWKDSSVTHRYDVWTKSECAMFNLHMTGDTDASNLPSGNGAIDQDQEAENPPSVSQSQETLTVILEEILADDGDAESLLTVGQVSLYSQTNSIFGNPWLDHVSDTGT